MDALPERFRDQHDLSFYYHDEIANMLVWAERDGVFRQTIRFENEADGKSFEASTNPIEWLHTSAYQREADGAFLAALLPALIADFCHFIYESLSCSRRGKMTNCFYQLRRPIKDTLFVLEWLLADSEDYLRRFRFQAPSEYAVEQVPRERKIEIINGAIVEANRPGWDANFLYDLRYNKNLPWSLEPLCQKAVHLVTDKNPAYATEPQNLNFIFTDNSCREDQWEHLYLVLPYILYYSAGVVQMLLKRFGAVRLPERVAEDDIRFALHNKSVEEARRLISEWGLEGIVVVTESQATSAPD